MSGIGSFSQEAYDQLRAAYAAEQLRADEQESAGVTIGKDNLGVETAPLKSAWLDKTGLWKYPDGRGEYQDVEQKQQDLLAAIRNENGEVEIASNDEENLDEMSDEEISGMINEILTDINEEEEEEEAPVEENTEDSDLSDMTDEELDALIDQLLAEDDEEEDSELSAEEIAERIEQLKAELAALTEASEEVEEEETEEDEAPEETEGEAEEETETEDDDTVNDDEEESPE